MNKEKKLLENKILLIDGNLLIFKSFYATFYQGSPLKTSKGVMTNAVYSFARIVFKLISEVEPTHIFFAFDKGSKTRRHLEYAKYKAGRTKTPQELLNQFPLVKKLIEKMQLNWYEDEKYEADDIIACLAEKYKENSDIFIFSSDQDLLQLVDTNVTIIDKKPRDPNFLYKNISNFFKIHNIKPSQVVDFKALVGDPSDNLPGVKGIGKKTAENLLAQYFSLDAIYQYIDNIKGSNYDKLIAGKKNAYLTQKLAKLVVDAKLPIKLSDGLLNLSDVEAAANYLNELEMKATANSLKMLSKKWLQS